MGQEDPFKKYGGKEVAQTEDPFKKYGGQTIVEPELVKKKIDGGVSLSKVGGMGGAYVAHSIEDDKPKKVVSGVGDALGISNISIDPLDPLKSISEHLGNHTQSGVKEKPISISPFRKEYAPVEYEEDVIREPLTGEQIVQRDIKLTPEAAKKTIDIVKKELFPTAEAARKYQYGYKIKTGKDAPPDNQTATLATEKIADYNRAVKALEDNKDDFTKGAVDYIKSGDSDLAKRLKTYGDKIPREVLGEAEWEALNDPNIIEASQKSKSANTEYFNRKYKFFDNYPEFHYQHIIELIAQGREDYGENNPFVNFVGVNSSDRVMEKLLEDKKVTQNDVEFYGKKVRPQIALHTTDILTPGLAESFLHGAVKGVTDIPKGLYKLSGLRNLMTDKAERLATDETEAFYQTHPKYSGINKLSSLTGELGGLLVPIAGTGKLLQIGNLVKSQKLRNELALGVTFYNDMHDAAEKDLPDNPILARVLALAQTAVFAKVADVFPSLAKDIAKGSGAPIKNILAELQAGNITGKQALGGITEQVLAMAGSATGRSTDIATKMTLATGINDGLRGIFTGKFDLEATGENMKQTFVDMFLGTMVPSAIASRPTTEKKWKEEIDKATTEVEKEELMKQHGEWLIENEKVKEEPELTPESQSKPKTVDKPSPEIKNETQDIGGEVKGGGKVEGETEQQFKERYIAKLKEISPDQPESWYNFQAQENWNKKVERNETTPIPKGEKSDKSGNVQTPKEVVTDAGIDTKSGETGEISPKTTPSQATGGEISPTLEGGGNVSPKTKITDLTKPEGVAELLGRTERILEGDDNPKVTVKRMVGGKEETRQRPVKGELKRLRADHDALKSLLGCLTKTV